MPDISPLISSRADNTNLYATATTSQITQIEGTGIVGTLTRDTPTLSKTITYPFKTGIYYIQLEVDFELTANATANDLILCAFAQADAGLNQVIQTVNPASLEAGSVIRVMLTGYINTDAVIGSNLLSIVIGTYTIGGGSAYQVEIPTDNIIYIEQVA